MNQAHNGISVVTILGTSRPGNYTRMALDLVNDELRSSGAQVATVDPADLELPFPGQPETKDSKELKKTLEGATGVILATPEYHGTFSSMLKLIIENLGYPSMLGGKPIALMGVAAGRIGAIKSLEQLRCVCSHVGGIVLPGPVSVANVRQVFDQQGKCQDQGVEKLLRGVATNLLQYVRQNVCPRIALEALVRGRSPTEPATQ